MTTDQYIPTPGYLLIDPLEKDEKSDYIHVQDPIDKSFKGTVVAVGDPKPTENGNFLQSPVKVGDFVLYSIAGCEECKLEHEGNPRHRFIIAPFGRILLTIK